VSDASGGGSGPAAPGTTADAQSAPSPLVRLFANDALKLAVLMAGIYLLFVGFGVALGNPLNGIVNSLRRVTFLAAVYAMAVLALNLHWGYTGLFNIGVAGFMAVGAYTMSMLTAAPSAPVPGLGLPLIVGMIGGVLAAAIVGGIVALPALRLRADYLAIVTIAFAEIIRYVYRLSAFQTFTVFGVDLGTGGARGISGADVDRVIVGTIVDNPVGQATIQPVIGALEGMGVVPNVAQGWVYALFLIVVVGAFYWLLSRLGNSPYGRVLKAIREDEDVARALGKNTGRFKMKAFMVGCGLMGLVGVLWQGSRGFLNPTENFLPQVTFFVWIALIIGGAGSNTGSVLGGAMFAALLFEGPQFVVRVVSNTVLSDVSAPATVVGALGALAGGDVFPTVAYVLANIDALRFVLVGVILVWLMQNRPDGLLGHRKETAASIDLRRPDRPAGKAAVAADGSGGTGTDAGDAAEGDDR
jgi:branched-chain amino acid transport system permease protein